MAPKTKSEMLDLVVTEEDEIVRDMEFNPRGGRQINRGRGRPRLRPSIHDPKTLERICERLLAGHGLFSMLDDDDYQFPTAREVYGELARNPHSEFSRGIYAARTASHWAIADRITQIVDEMTPERKDVVKAQIDWYKWHLGNLMPALYSERRILDLHANIEQPKLERQEFEDIAYRIVDEF